MLGTIVAVTALTATALLAGTFYAFDVSVVRGLRASDPRGAVGTMQAINVAIVNPWFLLSFLGAPVLTAVALVLRIVGGAPTVAVVGLAVALALCLAVIGLTASLHIPLNNALAAAGPPDGIADPAAVLARYLDRWAPWNVVRTLLSTAATVVLAATALG